MRLTHIFLSLFVSSWLVPGVLGQKLEGGCRVETTPESSPTPNNPLKELGGLPNIHKITKISLSWGKYTCILGLGATVVNEMTVTYQLKDGRSRDVTFGKKGGCHIGEHTLGPFQQDEFITRIDGFHGHYLDCIKVYTTKKSYGPYGGDNCRNPNVKFRRDRSVIKAIKWKSGEVVDRLGVYYGTDQLINRIIDSEVTVRPVGNGVAEDAYRVDQWSDNRNGRTPLTRKFEFSETVKETETVTVSKTSRLDVGLTMRGAFTKGVVSGSLKLDVGWSVEKTVEETKVEEREVTVIDSTTYAVLPGTRVRARFEFAMAEYSYEWNGPTKCVYSFDPKREENGGTVRGGVNGVAVFADTANIDISTTGGGNLRPPTPPPPPPPPRPSPPAKGGCPTFETKPVFCN